MRLTLAIPGNRGQRVAHTLEGAVDLNWEV